MTARVNLRRTPGVPSTSGVRGRPDLLWVRPEGLSVTRFGLYGHRTGTSVPEGKADLNGAKADIGARMSAAGGRAGLPWAWPELRFLAEGVL
jgi:hypothetical protein